jgi:hypothetical protein
MRAHWEALHESLSRSVRTLEASEQFQSIKQQHNALDRFGDPVEAVAYLADQSIDAGERNTVHACLVSLAQEASTSTLSMSILWLALWPALEAVYRRQLRFWRSNTDGLVSEIADAFTSLVRRMDLHRVNRIAATLVRSTERDVRAASQRSRKERVHEVELAEDFDLAGEMASFSPDEEAKQLRQLLTPVVGPDTDLVIAVLLLGHSQAEAALALGIAHDAARKRLQRAVARLRKHFGSACPISPRGSACTR